MTFSYHCPSCDAEIENGFTFGESAKTYGAPETCCDESFGEGDWPECCPECGEKIDENDIAKKAAELANDRDLEWKISRSEL